MSNYNDEWIPEYTLVKVKVSKDETLQYKVAGSHLAQSSEFFNALFRFVPPNYRNNQIVVELKVVEQSLTEALCHLLGVITSKTTKCPLLQWPQCKSVIDQYYEDKQPKIDSWEFLFDITIVCNQYLFDQYEQYYSDLFLNCLCCGTLSDPVPKDINQRSPISRMLEWSSNYRLFIMSIDMANSLSTIAKTFNLSHIFRTLEQYIQIQRSNNFRRIFR